MAITINGKTAIRHKVVYEVRYWQGFTYLDRCGRILNRIVELNPDWVVRDAEVNPQGAPLANLRTGTRFNFSAAKYDFELEQVLGKELAIEQDDIDQFVEQAYLLSGIVHEELGLKEFAREGFRIWYLFAADSKEDSDTWISQLNVLSVDTIAKAFEGTIQARGFTVVIAGKERKVRISVNSAERFAQLDLGDSILQINPRALSKDQDKVLLQQLKPRISEVGTKNNSFCPAKR